MSSDESEMCTPPEIALKAEIATNNLLPSKSKERYQCTFQKFMDWRLQNKITSFSENIFLAYFEDLSQKFKPSSLWAFYSMLKTMMNINNNIDIGNYKKLITLLKRKSDGFKSKKSKNLTTEEINTFLQNAPDEKYLLLKVILIIGISGACRKQELRNIKMEHIQNTGNSLIISIPDSKTKTQRSFVVSEIFYDKCIKYINMRPVGDYPFLVNYKNGKCTKQAVGVNTIGAAPKKIAEFLNLPEPKLYTGHCFRRSSATILVDAGGDLLSLKRLGGWKSSSVAENYVNESLKNKKNNSTLISNAINSTECPVQSTSTADLPQNTTNIENNSLTPNRSIQNTYNNCSIVINNYYKS